MNKLYIIIASLGLLIAAPNLAFAKVNIFACEPEWASLAKEIGGDLVKVKSATNASQDVHHIRAKPSLLASMRKADLVFCTGASLEIGWLPILLKKAGGPNVQAGTKGLLMASDYVELLNKLEKVDRSMGDVHPEGNPHVHLDPNNIPIIAETLANRLILIDKDNNKNYQSNLEGFLNKWDMVTNKWESDKALLKNKQVVVYHNSWAYLLKWLDIKSIASLEPKPGIPPTASHLKNVLDNIKGQDVKAILVAPFENKKAAKWLSEKSGIPIIEMPFTVGGNAKINNLIELFDDSLRLLKEVQ